MSGCLAGKIAATPIVFVRDVVDAPLVSLTNVFETWADRSDPWAAPTPGVGWTWNGGFNAGIAYPLGFFVFKGLSGVFGSVDYIVCRSLYPNFAFGTKPVERGGTIVGRSLFPPARVRSGGTIHRTPHGKMTRRLLQILHLLRNSSRAVEPKDPSRCRQMKMSRARIQQRATIASAR
jgi:hypothetical protein